LPFLRLQGARFALFTPTGGVLFAARILEDLADLLTRRGVALHDHAPVVEIDPAQAAVRTADGRQDRADALVIASGPWTPDLLPALAGRVTPSRQVALYLEPPAELRAAWAAAPMLLDQIEAASGGFYAVPPVDGTPLKVGDHGFSLCGHPERETRADRRGARDDSDARQIAPAGPRALSRARGEDLLLQRHRGRALHRRASGKRLDPGRLLRPRLQVRRAPRRAGRGVARGRARGG
jgi:glycine/D-amino acid oxidase-like deaminating enzyme